MPRYALPENDSLAANLGEGKTPYCRCQGPDALITSAALYRCLHRIDDFCVHQKMAPRALTKGPMERANWGRPAGRGRGLQARPAQSPARQQTCETSQPWFSKPTDYQIVLSGAVSYVTTQRQRHLFDAATESLLLIGLVRIENRIQSFRQEISVCSSTAQAHAPTADRQSRKDRVGCGKRFSNLHSLALIQPIFVTTRNFSSDRNLAVGKSTKWKRRAPE